jgi:hypothetical protein
MAGPMSIVQIKSGCSHLLEVRGGHSSVYRRIAGSDLLGPALTFIRDLVGVQ